MNTKIITERENIVAIANAVRSKTGKTEEFTLGEIATEIYEIETGTELPELIVPATEDEVFLNHEYIDENGEKKTGTFTIATELETQDDLLAQIEAALEGKVAGTTGEDVTAETNAYTEKITQLTTAVTALENELAGKASGGSGGGEMETCTVSFKASEYLEPPIDPEIVVYMGNDSQPYSEEIVRDETIITIRKGSIITIFGANHSTLQLTNALEVYHYGAIAIYVNDNAIITY